MQDQVDPNGVEWKDDKAPLGLLQNTGVEQGMDIGVHGFHIAVDPPSGLADGHRPGAGQRSDQLPAFRGQEAKQQLRGREADPRALLLSFERVSCPPFDIVWVRDMERDRFHFIRLVRGRRAIGSPVTRPRSARDGHR